MLVTGNGPCAVVAVANLGKKWSDHEMLEVEVKEAGSKREWTGSTGNKSLELEYRTDARNLCGFPPPPICIAVLQRALASATH